MLTPAVTVTFLVAVLPSESVTRTTSVTPPVEPAVYAPVPAPMEPPELFVWNDQVYPVALPPLAEKDWPPLGATLALAGEMLTPAPTVTFTVAVFPSES